MEVIKPINWDKINAIKNAGRMAVQNREEELRRQHEQEIHAREVKSRRRYDNFVELMRTEIGDLVDEFTITVYGDDDGRFDWQEESSANDAVPYYLSHRGLCATTRIAFYLNLPQHNPIHVYVVYGTSIDGKWQDSDVPKFNDQASKFSVYMDPAYRQKIVNKIRKINRVDQTLNKYAKGYGFDNIGEALVVAEEFYRTHHDTNSVPNMKLRETIEADQQVREVESFARTVGLDPETTSQLISVPGQDLSQKIQSLFTLSKQNYQAQKVGAGGVTCDVVSCGDGQFSDAQKRAAQTAMMHWKTAPADAAREQAAAESLTPLVEEQECLI